MSAAIFTGLPMRKLTTDCGAHRVYASGARAVAHV